MAGLEVRMEMISHFAGDECVTLKAGWLVQDHTVGKWLNPKHPGLLLAPLAGQPAGFLELCQSPHALRVSGPNSVWTPALPHGVRAKPRDKTSFHSERLLRRTISVFTFCFLLHPSTELRKTSSKNTGLLVDFGVGGDVIVALGLFFLKEPFKDLSWNIYRYNAIMSWLYFKISQAWEWEEAWLGVLDIGQDWPRLVIVEIEWWRPGVGVGGFTPLFYFCMHGLKLSTI